MPKYVNCVLHDKLCDDCGNCDLCDLNSSKVCDSCCECIDDKNVDYRGVEIDEVLTDENSLIVDELDFKDLKKETDNPMDYSTDDGLTLDIESYDTESEDYEIDEEEEYED